MPRRRAYGAWPSPLSAARVTAATIDLSQLQSDGDDLYWLEGRPHESGRQVLVRRRADGRVEDVLPPPWNARTRVHEYGGGSYLARGGVVWFSSFDDQRLHRLDPGGGPQPVTPDPPVPSGVRYADYDLAPDGRWLVAVREVHDAGGGAADVRNDLVAVPADGSGEPVALAFGRDFYAAPRISPDGRRLAYVCWDHPAMPWDTTELHVAELHLDVDGPRLLRDRTLDGSAASVVEPAWSPDGVLHACTDASGWWNLAREDDGRLRTLHDHAVELGDPLWELGMERFAFLDDGRIACSWHDEGHDRLGVLDVGTGSLRPLEVTTYGCGWVRAVRGGRIAVLTASPTELPAVALVDPGTGDVDVVHAPATADVDGALVALPQPITFPTADGSAEAYALYYPPTNAAVEAAAGERPPLLVHTHGGPTGHTRTLLNLAVQFWTSRGFAFVAVEYRGSTGRGRAYRQALRGRWGIVDVEDAVAAAAFLVERGDADPVRVAIRGGSAGGYTTLRALTTTDVFAAGASYFGVADVGALAADTHKFESRYLEGLIPPQEYADRSPITHVDQLSVPMIILQGLEDAVVPPAQAEAMVAALDHKGLPYAYLAFEGEQHGFRRRENQIRALEAELAFYGEVFGFTPADDLPPLDLRNR